MDSLHEKEMRLEQLMPLIRERLAAGQNVRFSPRGTSMLPMLRQGTDSVILSPVPGKLKKYDLPLYQRENGQYVLHRIVSVGDTYTCSGDNQFRFEQGLRQEQMIAVVSSFFRKNKEHKVTDLGYRVYCRIWYFSRPLRYVCRRCFGWLRKCMK